LIADAHNIAAAVAFVNATMGKPWVKGATGPDAWCCWTLAQAGQRLLFGREIAMIGIDEDSAISVARAMRNHPLWAAWERHDQPMHGDVVKMWRPSNPNHVGTYLALDRGGIHHCQRGSGVVFDAVFNLPTLGWSRLEYWRPKVTP
jgi:hypothetical protein